MVKHKLFNAITLFLFSVILFAILLVLIYTGVINEYLGHILTLAGINTIIALGLNMITGFTGQLALGQAGFMMVGAYSTAIVMMKGNIPLLPAVLFGGVVSALFGILIGFPTLRLRGDYLAITTLGFGEILRVIINNLEGLTGGASGLKNIPSFDDLDFEKNAILAFIWVFWFTVIAVAVVSNLVKSSHGRAIISVREDEIASNSMGIDIARYKMIAFTLSAFLAGTGGGLYAIFQQYLDPKNAGWMSSVFFVVYIVFGGLGSITGTIISTVLLTFLQEVLRFLGDYRLIFFSLLLIAMMIFWPKGIMGNKEFSIVTVVKRILKRLFKWDVDAKENLQGQSIEERGENK